MKNIYLDYTATTPVKKEVLDSMIPYLSEFYGNPSSLYSIGIKTKDAILDARQSVADAIGADLKEVFFTSGGTEADNWALEGVAFALKHKGNHIITTKIEHHAILDTAKFLELQGFEVTYLDVDENGLISLEQLENSITDNTILVSVMMANNEMGSVQPIKKISEICKKHKVLLHSDGVQVLGSFEFNVKDLGVDLMSFSSHKIYGPKGVGALYIRKGVRIRNFLNGGGQENKKRGGTENLAGIIGFGKAAELANKDLKAHIAKMKELKAYLKKGLLENIDDIQINGDIEGFHPSILSVSFHYIEGESILLMLDFKNIYISTGSACSSSDLTPSHVLDAMGVPVGDIHGTVRFSVGDFTTKEDLDYTINEVAAVIKRLREISPVSQGKGW